MAFFTSEYDCKLDSKGRFTLPARVKANLPQMEGDQLVVRLGFEPCLVLYPLIEFKKVFQKIASLSEFNAEYRKLQRNFFRGNAQVELDKNGRINLPKSMREFAALEKEAILVGLGNRLELWSPERYREYLITDPEELSGLAEDYLLEK